MKRTLRQFSYLLRRQGSILVVTLWILIILSILSVALGNLAFSQIRFTNFYIRSIVSPFLAKAAYYDAIFERNHDKAKFDTKKGLLKERERKLKNNNAYKYHFEDEYSKININIASSEILQRLPGLNEELAKSITESKRRPFRIKEEIFSVKGLTDDKFSLFRDLVTVYGEGQVNINTVSKEALLALGIDDGLAGVIMRYRDEYEGEDEVKGTEDDGAFLSVDSILSELRKFEMLTLRQEQELLNIKDSLTVKSEILKLNVSTKVIGKTGNIYSIVVDTANNKILSWDEE